MRWILIIWLLGPTLTGEVREVGPVAVGSYATEAACIAQMKRMARASDFKVRGICEPWQ
jgi:hypothetical protein